MPLTSLSWGTRNRHCKIGNHITVTIIDHIPSRISLGRITLVWRHCCWWRFLRISASSLSGWNLNYIRRCRIWILIVGIIISCRHWYGVVRPPEWAKDASNNYSTKETANYRTPWHESSKGVAPESIAAAIATADVPAIYPTTAASAVATPNMSTVHRTTASAIATADVPAVYCTTAAVTTADVSPVYRTTASAVTTADVSAVYR